MIAKRVVTFIPGIWTHSTAVPVAFDRNSVKVSSAMDISLENKQHNLISHTNQPQGNCRTQELKLTTNKQ